MDNINYQRYVKYLKYKEKYLELKNKNIVHVGGGCDLLDSKTFKFKFNNNVYDIEINENVFNLHENSKLIKTIQMKNMNIFFAINITMLLIKKMTGSRLFLYIKKDNQLIKYEVTDETSDNNNINFRDPNSFVAFYKEIFGCNETNVVPNGFNKGEMDDIISNNNLNLAKPIQSPSPSSKPQQKSQSESPSETPSDQDKRDDKPSKPTRGPDQGIADDKKELENINDQRKKEKEKIKNKLLDEINKLKAQKDSGQTVDEEGNDIDELIHDLEGPNGLEGLEASKSDSYDDSDDSNDSDDSKENYAFITNIKTN